MPPIQNQFVATAQQLVTRPSNTVRGGSWPSATGQQLQRRHPNSLCGLAGAPLGETVRAFDGFVVSYDPRLRNPRWVLERITRDSVKGDGDRFNVPFMEDGAIEERFRARLSDYKASGYDKGHLAPAANHKNSQQSVVDTFTLTNIAPQVSASSERC